MATFFSHERVFVSGWCQGYHFLIPRCVPILHQTIKYHQCPLRVVLKTLSHSFGTWNSSQFAYYHNKESLSEWLGWVLTLYHTHEPDCLYRSSMAPSGNFLIVLVQQLVLSIIISHKQQSMHPNKILTLVPWTYWLCY